MPAERIRNVAALLLLALGWLCVSSPGEAATWRVRAYYGFGGQGAGYDIDIQVNSATVTTDSDVFSTDYYVDIVEGDTIDAYLTYTTGEWFLALYDELDNEVEVSLAASPHVSYTYSGPRIFDYTCDPSSETFSPAIITPGETLSIEIDVMNNGSCGEGTVTLKFLASADTVVSDDDYYVSSTSAAPPAAGAEAVTWGFSFPNTIPDGTYWLLWEVDPDGYVTESDETNNEGIFSQGQFTVTGSPAKADLQCFGDEYDEFTPTAVTPGTTVLSVDVGIINNDTAHAGPFTVKFYASLDTTITETDYLIGTRDLSGLDRYEFDSVLWAGFFPANVPPGTYWFGWIVDTYDEVDESDETNNVYYKPDQQLTVDAPSTDVDLHADVDSAHSFTPTSVTPGSTSFSVSLDVVNDGTAASGSFFVEFYASTDTTIDVTDCLIGTQVVADVAAGGTSTVSWSNVFPDTVPSGTYNVGWRIDWEGDVPEADETNNTGYKTAHQLTVAADTDLTTSAPDSNHSFSPTTAVPNLTTVSLDVYLENAGTVGAGPFKIAVYASSDETITAADYLLGEIDAGGLAAGSADTFSWSGVVSGTVPVGAYWVGWIIDSSDSVPESNESNNVGYKTAYQLDVTPGTVDLVPSAIDAEGWFAPSSATAGVTTVTVSIVVRNDGNVDSGSLQIGFRASTDTTIAVPDALIGGDVIDNIPALSERTASWTGTLPAYISPGTYWVGWVVDPQGLVVETDETNNVSYEPSGQLVVTALPDLRPDETDASSGFTPSTVTAGETAFDVSVMVLNERAGASAASRVDFYVSEDADITAADHLLGSANLGAIAPFSSALAAWSGTFPATVPAGTYWVGWIVDAGDAIAELDETDNSGHDSSAQITVSAGGAIEDDGGGCTPSTSNRGPMPDLSIGLALMLFVTLSRRRQTEYSAAAVGQ